MRDPAGAPARPALHLVRLDLSDPRSVRRAVAAAQEVASGPPACVVDNAGWALFGAVEDERAPFRCVSPDPHLAAMAPDAAGDDERHAAARRLFGLAPGAGTRPS